MRYTNQVIIEIDQSGKVENTSKDTVIALSSNKGLKRSIKISAREKRKLQKFFRQLGKPRFYTHKVFSILIFLLIRRYASKLDRIVIDPEYPGYESLLRNLLSELLVNSSKEFEPSRIVFKRLGKRAQAHKVANTVFRKEAKPSMTVSSKDILKIITK